MPPWWSAPSPAPSCSVKTPALKIGHRTVGSIVDPSEHDPEQVLKKYKSRLGWLARAVARHQEARFPDRSKIIFILVSDLHRLGASASEIASVLWHNVYFQSKYGSSLDALQTEVSRIIAKLEG